MIFGVENLLKGEVPYLFRMMATKDATVEEFLPCLEARCQWNPVHQGSSPEGTREDRLR